MAKVYPQAYFGSSLVPIENATLKVTSSAVLYGLSVYTVFPVQVTGGVKSVFRFSDHFTRLKNSARIIGIDAFEREWTEGKFLEAVQEVVGANDITEDVFVRATVHVTDDVPGTRSRGLSIALSIFLYEAAAIVPQDGMRLKTSVWRRIPDYSIPSRAKVNGAYVNSVLAKQDALDSGYDDCILLDASGHVCELSAANIFLVRDGVLITPDTASDILEGINRRTIIDVARDAGITVVERSVDLTELYVASEAFACGTSAFVAPVKEIDKRTVGNGEAGGITKMLRAKSQQIMRGEDPKYLHFLTKLP